MRKAQIIELLYSLRRALQQIASNAMSGKICVFMCLKGCHGSRIIEKGFIHGNHECMNEWLNSNKSLSMIALFFHIK